MVTQSSTMVYGIWFNCTLFVSVQDQMCDSVIDGDTTNLFASFAVLRILIGLAT